MTVNQKSVRSVKLFHIGTLMFRSWQKWNFVRNR